MSQRVSVNVELVPSCLIFFFPYCPTIIMATQPPTIPCSFTQTESVHVVVVSSVGIPLCGMVPKRDPFHYFAVKRNCPLQWIGWVDYWNSVGLDSPPKKIGKTRDTPFHHVDLASDLHFLLNCSETNNQLTNQPTKVWTLFHKFLDMTCCSNCSNLSLVSCVSLTETEESSFCFPPDEAWKWFIEDHPSHSKN